MNTGNAAIPQHPGSNAPEAPKPQRMDWPDIAKGISILGVVLLHVTLSIPGAENTLLAQFNQLLDPLRMPLFFLVSGFFSVKVLNQTFSELFRKRLWFFIVPYCIWTPINLYTHRLEGTIFTGRVPATAEWYLDSMVLATNMYWFLFYLVIFNIALWATRKFPAWAIIATTAIPWLLLPAFSEFELVRKSILFLPAFFIGAYFRPLITRFAHAAAKPQVIVFACCFYLLGLAVNVFADGLRAEQNPGQVQTWFINLKNFIATALGGELSGFDLDHIPGLITRLISLPAGIVMCVCLAKIKPVGKLLMFLGRHTLPIYIGHALGLTMIFGFTLRWNFMEIDNLHPSPWHWSVTWMIIAFACAMLGAYIIHLVSLVPVLGWTLVPPALPEFKVEAPQDMSGEKLGSLASSPTVSAHPPSQD